MRTVSFCPKLKKGRIRTTILGAAAAALFVPTAAMADHDKGKGKSQDHKHHHHHHEFFLFGAAAPAQDPENPANEVVRFRANADTGIFSGVGRWFDEEKVQVRDLDNQLEARHRFQSPDTCGGGSPRIQLAIDLDNDGDTEGNAFGYYGTNPNFTGCPAEVWNYEDFTGGDTLSGPGPAPSTGDPARGEENAPPNEELEWDTSQLSSTTDEQGETTPGPVIPAQPFVISWSQLEAVIHSTFPKHRVCSAVYVDDAGAPPEFGGGPTGESHADLISLGDATLNGWDDIGKAPKGSACASKLKGKGHDHHDHDHDD